MCTVPAHSFSAPTRAKLIAAARFMPGVWAVLASSWSPGITRTPVLRQSVCVVLMTATISRSAVRASGSKAEFRPECGWRGAAGAQIPERLGGVALGEALAVGPKQQPVMMIDRGRQVEQ